MIASSIAVLIVSLAYLGIGLIGTGISILMRNK